MIICGVVPILIRVFGDFPWFLRVHAVLGCLVIDVNIINKERAAELVESIEEIHRTE